MKVNIRNLNVYRAPAELIQFVRQLKVEEIEASELIGKLIRVEQYEDAYFILDHFVFEKDEYDSILQDIFKVTKSQKIYHGFNLSEVENAVSSTNITNSQSIFYCNDVSNSKHIYNSNFVTNSSEIYTSSVVDHSKRVIFTSGADYSENILYSNFVVQCKNTLKASNAINCTNIFHCNDVVNVHCSGFCKALSNSIFCWAAHGENLLFNKAASTEVIDVIIKQYERISKPLTFVDDWPYEDDITIETIAPSKLKVNQFSYFADQTKDFWNWIKTLPNYDESVIGLITGKKSF